MIVPAHEFLKLNLSSIARSITPRRRFLSLTAFGEKYNLNLELRDDVLIGKKTPIWHVKSHFFSPSNVKYTLISNVSWEKQSLTLLSLVILSVSDPTIFMIS